MSQVTFVLWGSQLWNFAHTLQIALSIEWQNYKKRVSPPLINQHRKETHADAFGFWNFGLLDLNYHKKANANNDFSFYFVKNYGVTISADAADTREYTVTVRNSASRAVMLVNFDFDWFWYYTKLYFLLQSCPLLFPFYHSQWQYIIIIAIQCF